jgi:hypothetical protein
MYKGRAGAYWQEQQCVGGIPTITRHSWSGRLLRRLQCLLTGSHFMLTDCSEQATILIGSMKVACAWATKSGER